MDTPKKDFAQDGFSGQTVGTLSAAIRSDPQEILSPVVPVAGENPGTEARSQVQLQLVSVAVAEPAGDAVGSGIAQPVQ